MKRLNRRIFLKTTAAGLLATTPAWAQSNSGTKPIVGVTRCRRYEFEKIKASLKQLFDWLGDISSLVKGKTVTVKINLTSYRTSGVYTLPTVQTVYTHPMVTLAACSLFQDYQARRIVICESNPTNDETRESFHNQYYDVALFESMIENLEWENTKNKGTHSNYLTSLVGEDAYLYRSFDFNHRYVDTDVMVSIAKMKNHDIAGITLSMKNLFGITPNAIYADPGNERTTMVRGLLHSGTMRPSADGEILPVPSHDAGFRVPRIIVDINRARPIDLAIIDGIVSQSGGEGPWNGSQVGVTVPNLLIAGRNAVATDTVGASIMGYDPEADDFTKPFYNGANTLRLANARGLGTNRVADIDVAGMSIKEARYNYLPGKDNQ